MHDRTGLCHENYEHIGLINFRRRPNRVKLCGENNGISMLTKFKYTKIFANHFNFRHILNDHNHIKHISSSIVEILVTH